MAKKNVIGQVIDAYAEHEARRERQGCYILLFAGAALAACGIIIMIVGTIMTVIEEGNVVRTYGDAIASLCQAMPGGSADADELPDSSTPRQIVLLKAGTRQRADLLQQLPVSWRASSEEDVQLVGCVEEISTSIETCSYARSSDDGSYTLEVERLESTTVLKLLNPESGRVIAVHDVRGAAPDECPDDYDSSLASRRIQGDPANPDAFVDWLEPYILDQ